MNKLALQADLCYNLTRNIVVLGGAGNTPSRINLYRRFIMDTIPSNTPQKQCRDCKDFFPATPEYFHHSHRYSDGLNSMCKVCKKKEYQKVKEREHITLAEKRCTSCENVFPGTSEFFHSNRVNKDGLNSRCKSCIRAYQNSPGTREHILAKRADYRSRPETKEKARSYQKFYRTRPEVQDRNRIRDRERHNRPERQAWRQAYYSRPEIQEHHRAYLQVYRPIYYSRPEVREHKRFHDRHYHETHRERYRELSRVGSHTRRARKRAIRGTYTTAQIQDLLNRQHYRCYYCSKKFEKRNGKYIYHIDHTFPINRVAGTNIPANDISYLVLACPPCNQSKSDKFPWEWPEGGRLL